MVEGPFTTAQWELEQCEAGLLVIARHKCFRRRVVEGIEREARARLVTVNETGSGLSRGTTAKERAVMRRRTLAALDAKRARRDRVGGVPYGFRAEGATLVADPAEQAVIARVRALRADGRSYAWIANRLAVEGHAPRSGKRWHPTQVRRMLGGARLTGAVAGRLPRLTVEPWRRATSGRNGTSRPGAGSGAARWSTSTT